jgi:cytochrome c556
MAQNDPQKLAGAMQRYVNTERLLQQNPAQGFAEIARNMGLSPQQVGKMLMGQDPGQADPRDRQIMQLHQQLQQLQQQTGKVTQTMQQQREQAVLSQVEQFAKANPRFDELSEEIANMLSTGYAKDLQDAYEKAERLNPAPAPVVQDVPPAPPAQTRPARSLTGAPSHGSNPTTNRTPSKSPRDALKRAFGV